MSSKQLGRRHFLQLTAMTTTSTFLGIYPPAAGPQDAIASGSAMPFLQDDCLPWCESVNGSCQPTSVQINALRLRTRDGRYLQALGGGEAGLVAVRVVPQQWETFLFASPTTWPLVSGEDDRNLIRLEVCNDNWGPSGFFMRADVTGVPPSSSGGVVGILIGGPGARVLLARHPNKFGDERERIFFVEKTGGGSITTGDEISISTLSRFYFRTTGPEEGAFINADGTSPGQEDTVFVVEVNQVVEGLGWRPASVQCQTCGSVSGIVTDGENDAPIAGAVVEVQGTNFKATTGSDGRFTLSDPNGRNCVPAGDQTLVTSADTYQRRSELVIVFAGGSASVQIELHCTEVRGKVIAPNGQPVAEAGVILVEPNGQSVMRPDGSLIEDTTAADGTFVLRCVPHGSRGVWADGASVQTITVPPEGLSNIVIKLGGSICGDVIGTVTDADTGQPIAGAKVKVIGSNPGEDEATTDAAGNFRIECVSPAGGKSLRTTASGYQTGRNSTNVPATGDSTPVDIKLRRIPVSNDLIIVLTWGVQPSDLDSHLSGPDGQVDRFHLFFGNLTSPPVEFAGLDVDDTTEGQGPETIKVRRSPSVGTFIAGEYRYWVHNFSRSTFAASDAVVKVSQNGVQLGQFAAANAAGDPADDIWHVVNLQIDTNGTVSRITAIQTFQPGDENTIL